MSPLDVGLSQRRPSERTLAQIERECLLAAFRRDPDRFWLSRVYEYEGES